LKGFVVRLILPAKRIQSSAFRLVACGVRTGISSLPQSLSAMRLRISVVRLTLSAVGKVLSVIRLTLSVIGKVLSVDEYRLLWAARL